MVLHFSRYAVTCVVVCALLLSSCRPSEQPTVTRTEQNSVSEAEVSEPFETQLQRVQSSDLTEIRFTERPLDHKEVEALLTVKETLQVLECRLDSSTTDRLEAQLFEKSLPQFQQLRQLVIHSSVDDELVEAISESHSLRVVNLPKSSVTKVGLLSLSKLPELELLRISSDQLTDDSLETLQEMPNLRFLHLINCSITDAGLPTIVALKQLESFYLDGSQCTDAGLSNLVKSRPDLHFHWNDSHVNEEAHPHEH